MQTNLTTLPMAEPQTFLFRTGVRPGNFSDYPPCQEHEVRIDGIQHIKFMCHDVPAGATFAFAQHSPDGDKYNQYIVREIVGGGLLSKYAYFKKPLVF